MELTCKPIGVIHTPYREPRGTPIQPTGALGIEGTVEVFPEYAGGLKDLDGFSHLILLYYFHLSGGCSLTVRTPCYVNTKNTDHPRVLAAPRRRAGRGEACRP